MPGRRLLVTFILITCKEEPICNLFIEKHSDHGSRCLFGLEIAHFFNPFLFADPNVASLVIC